MCVNVKEKAARAFFGKVAMKFGKVAEWSKAPVSKTGRGVSFSGVRISPFPQFFEKGFRTKNMVGAKFGLGVFVNSAATK